MKVRRAVETVLREGVSVTGDVNPKNSVSTLAYARAVITKL